MRLRTTLVLATFTLYNSTLRAHSRPPCRSVPKEGSIFLVCLFSSPFIAVSSTNTM